MTELELEHLRRTIPAKLHYLLDEIDGLRDALADVMPFITDENNAALENRNVTAWWLIHRKVLAGIPRPGQR